MLLPIRRSLANLGLYSETLGKTNPFKIIGINKSDLETGLVGIEYESNFTPTGVQIRKLKDFLIEQKLIKEVADNVDLLNCIKKNIFQDISEIMVNEYPKTDGGGIELRFHPASFKAQKHLHYEYARILKLFQDFGFTDEMGTDGIHVNIDKKLFGGHANVRRNSFANFIWFLYTEQQFMHEFCNRKRRDDQFSDMLSLLTDRFGNLNKDEIMAMFLTEKNLLLDAIESNELAKALNIQMNKGGRATVEFRWFGSTHDINIFMSFIDFSFAMAEYSQIINSPMLVNLQDFSKFVALRHQKYDYLYDRMRTLNSSKQAMSIYDDIVRAMKNVPIS